MSFGKGFSTWRTMRATLDDGTPVTWHERYLVMYSPAQAQQQERLHKRLERAEAALRKLKPQTGERAADVLARATTILERHTATDSSTWAGSRAARRSAAPQTA